VEGAKPVHWRESYLLDQQKTTNKCLVNSRSRIHIIYKL